MNMGFVDPNYEIQTLAACTEKSLSFAKNLWAIKYLILSIDRGKVVCTC
jgi:hypothetical protein